jgi:hypothetical protein
MWSTETMVPHEHVNQRHRGLEQCGLLATCRSVVHIGHRRVGVIGWYLSSSVGWIGLLRHCG